MQSEFSNSEMCSEGESELKCLVPEVQRCLYKNSIKVLKFVRWMSTVINTLKTKCTLSSALGELSCTEVPLIVISCQVELPTRITAQLTLKNTKIWKLIHIFVSPIRTLLVEFASWAGWTRAFFKNTLATIAETDFYVGYMPSSSISNSLKILLRPLMSLCC